MKILVTGSNGQLGKALQNLDIDGDFTDLNELDITNPQELNSVNWSDYDGVINAAAYTNVDLAETKGFNLNWKVNVLGPAMLAKAARDNDVTLVHISSDYVFNGDKTSAYTEDDRANPLSSYGAAKYAGDVAVSSISEDYYILRTSWVIGEGKNFVETIAKLAENHEELEIIDDNIGRPTFSSTLAEAAIHVINRKPKPGLYNITNPGNPVSWLGFAKAITQNLDYKTLIKPTTTEKYYSTKPEAAKRPLNSLLSIDKIKSIGFSPNDWQDELEKYLERIK